VQQDVDGVTAALQITATTDSTDQGIADLIQRVRSTFCDERFDCRFA